MSNNKSDIIIIIIIESSDACEREREQSLRTYWTSCLCVYVCVMVGVDVCESKIEFILQSPPFNLQFLIINFPYRAPYCALCNDTTTAAYAQTFISNCNKQTLDLTLVTIFGCGLLSPMYYKIYRNY